jgi:hypothetical protein
VGERYENVQVPKNNPNWRGLWDCAEFVSWVVFQDAGILYGCLGSDPNPATADAYTGAWRTDLERRGVRVPYEQAAAIPGAIVLRYPPAPDTMGHIAICDGSGGTVEAKGKAFGVVRDTVQGRRWDTGVLIPGVYYDMTLAPLAVVGPARLYHAGALNMDPDVVAEIQRLLRDAGYDPGPIDGIFGAKTTAAVAAFQAVEGIVVDGEVGPQTAARLGLAW